MKIGLSYSRCLLDIVDGRVDFDDVLVIISRTDFDPENDEHWTGIWNGYFYGANPQWSGRDPSDEEKFRKVTIDLYKSGKLHQPRQFGAHPYHSRYFWLDTQLPPDELENNPAAKKAYERYLVIAELSSTKYELSPELDDNF